jgi:probable F420-dependent oxidoreductase
MTCRARRIPSFPVPTERLEPPPGPLQGKVRIGLGLGVRTRLHGPDFGDFVDLVEQRRFDSLWLSDRINGPAPDPLVAMAFAAGRTRHLKFGMAVMVLPGRNPVVLAKELATLAVMSGGRLLPAFGLGAADGREHQAFGVERAARAGWFDEALHVIRRCWTGEPVVHEGERFRYDGIALGPVPGRLDVWLGGRAPSELRRVGRLADGWLPSFVTPAEAEDGRRVIEQVAAEHERSIDADHYGVLIPYSLGPVPEQVLATFAARRPDIADPAALVPVGWDAVTSLIGRFVDVGTTKFVLLPLDEPADTGAWERHLDEAAEAVLRLET